ncbi:hypothetical protein MD484_g5266, partial [Candolleomyces efflorescens]
MTILTPLLGAAAIVYIMYQRFMFYRIRDKVSFPNSVCALQPQKIELCYEICNIPTMGSDGFLGATIDSFKFILHGHRLIKDGYFKYKGLAFKIPTITTSSGWLIVVTDERMIEELRKAPEDVLSFRAATIDSLQAEVTFGKHAHAKDFHVTAVRNPLTRALSGRFTDIRDEIVESCNYYLPNGKDWVLSSLQKNVIHIVCQTSNRLFVGLPLCRDPEYCKIQEDWTVHVAVAVHITYLCPGALKPLAKIFMNKVESMTKKAEKFLGPMVVERLEKDAKYGPSWEGRPTQSDLVSWLIDLAPLEHKNVEDITFRVMAINFAAIHTTSITLTNALLDVAARPEYIKPLREEMEEIIGNYGWTKEGMGQMRRLDSFLKESSRLAGIGDAAGRRKAVKDFTFTNGLTIPSGYTVTLSNSGVHTDPILNLSTDSDSWIWEIMAGILCNIKWYLLILHTYYLVMDAKLGSPGRFLAVNEIKAMMAHIILNYDIKLPGDSKEVPAGQYFETGRSPAPGAEVLLRRRKND